MRRGDAKWCDVEEGRPMGRVDITLRNFDCARVVLSSFQSGRRGAALEIDTDVEDAVCEPISKVEDW